MPAFPGRISGLGAGRTDPMSAKDQDGSLAWIFQLTSALFQEESCSCRVQRGSSVDDAPGSSSPGVDRARPEITIGYLPTGRA